MGFRPKFETIATTHTLMPVRAATTGNISLFYPGGSYFQDSVLLNNGDRMLVRAQTNAVDNGIYIFDQSRASSGNPFQRAFDMELETSLLSGSMFVCREGTTFANKIFTVVFASVITPYGLVGTDTMTLTAH